MNPTDNYTSSSTQTTSSWLTCFFNRVNDITTTLYGIPSLQSTMTNQAILQASNLEDRSLSRRASAHSENVPVHLCPVLYSPSSNQRHMVTELNDPKQIQTQLIQQITQLKQQNQETEKQFKDLEQFIEEDEELTSLLYQCSQETKEILLPPPKRDNSEPVNHPLVEEWRQEMQTTQYFESRKTRFRDFLEKNPSFVIALGEKCQKVAGSESPLEIGWVNSTDLQNPTVNPLDSSPGKAIERHKIKRIPHLSTRKFVNFLKNKFPSHNFSWLLIHLKDQIKQKKKSSSLKIEHETQNDTDERDPILETTCKQETEVPYKLGSIKTPFKKFLKTHPDFKKTLKVNLGTSFGKSKNYLRDVKTFIQQGIKEDKDRKVRLVAMGIAAEYIRKTKDRECLKLLLDIFENQQEDELLRSLAYQSIVRAVKKKHLNDLPSASELATLSEERINWKIIKRARKMLKESSLSGM